MKHLVFLITLLISQISNAQIDRKGNGGDVCENKFKIIRDDIRNWINEGGSTGLVLPATVKLSQYNSEMLNKITKAQVSCVDEAVKIRATEKTCINFSEIDGSLKIVCNRNRFLSATDDDQYVLVHHEYAGLAGFEVNSGVSSDYAISNQLSQYLQDVVVKKLGIKPQATQLPETPFSKLRNMYLTATLPATYSDFPSPDYLKCALAEKDTKRVYEGPYSPQVFQAESAGPEFPGKKIVTFVEKYVPIPFSVVPGTIRDTKMTSTDTDLISSMQALPPESRGIMIDNTPLKYYFRKSTKGYIAGKAELKIGKSDASTLYFYCWN